MGIMPNYLRDYEQLYAENPRLANLQWFRNARYGLFLHYGLYSLMTSDQQMPQRMNEWVQLNERTPVMEYERRKGLFRAEKFDAERIAAFAVDCGMKYINLTTRHHDSVCLWETKETDFHAVNSPAGKDLVGELAEACERHGLGLFLYYSHGRDWRHPHAPNNDRWGGSARPLYDPPEPSYAYGLQHDLNLYLEFMNRQIIELLTMFPTVAGIWLDGVAVPLSGDPDKFRLQELYDLIHSKQPHVLLSYKQGVTGTEDFFAPEHSIPTRTANGEGNERELRRLGKIGQSPDKFIEICTTMIEQPVSWGYTPNGAHKSEEQVWAALWNARAKGANLLLNTAPLPDGSLDSHDEAVLRRVGERLRSEGFPGI